MEEIVDEVTEVVEKMLLNKGIEIDVHELDQVRDVLDSILEVYEEI